MDNLWTEFLIYIKIFALIADLACYLSTNLPCRRRSIRHTRLAPDLMAPNLRSQLNMSCLIVDVSAQ
jgi:hypothetical protein